MCVAIAGLYLKINILVKIGLICKMMCNQPDYVSAISWTTALVPPKNDLNTLSPVPRVDNFLDY